MKKIHLLVLLVVCLASGLARAESTGSVQDQKRDWDVNTRLTRDDLTFFFDRVTCSDGEWHFKLSTNMHEMRWRIRNADLDLGGVCQAGQVLDVALGSSFEITREDFYLRFHPIGDATYQVFFKTKPAEGCWDDVRAREAILSPSARGYDLAL